MTRNGQFCPIHNFSNLFPSKWLRMTQNGQFCLIHNFSNLFPPKWFKMTWNGQFCSIHNFSNLFLLKLPNLQLLQSSPTKVAQNDSEWLILPNLQFFHSFATEVAKNDLELTVLPDSQLFPPKWLRMTQNSQQHKLTKMQKVIKRWNAHFWITFNFWLSTEWS